MITKQRKTTPTVLSLNALDPSGMTGLHADIETCASVGAHCLSVASAIMARDTQEIKEIVPVDPGLVVAQTRALLEDIPVSVIKSGILASVENIEVLHSILIDYPDLKLIIEPDTLSGEPINQREINNQSQAIKALLMPKACFVVMNYNHAYKLSTSADTLDACAAEIVDSGCEHLLITGLPANPEQVTCKLFGERGFIRGFKANSYQSAPPGANAIFSACVAAYLAHGMQIQECVAVAQQFTREAINQARYLGMGQAVTNRMHWAADNNKNKA